MYIQRISLNGFKNYDLAEFNLSPGVNVLYGPNGAGKTNLLDAVHYLSSCKSFLVSSDTQNIKTGGDFFFVEGWVSEDAEQTDMQHLQCAVKKGQGKVFRRNKKEYEKLSDHIGLFPVVVIAPGDHELLHGGSAERRRFMDSLISVYDKNYLSQLIQYGKLIEQRNAFLKQCSERGLFRDDMLEIYDAQLCEPALYLFEKRNELISQLLPLFYEMYGQLSQTDETPTITVKADLLNVNNLLELFAQTRDKDKNLLYTSAGPHKDDFEFTLSGLNVKTAASQGQQKTFLTALKLARYHLIQQKTGKTPVLLLDDIFDKLDESRVKNLIHIISNAPFGQVLITDTGKNRMNALMDESGIAGRELEINLKITANEAAV
jgi:DNA replication and repair protein RecF